MEVLVRHVGLSCGESVADSEEHTMTETIRAVQSLSTISMDNGPVDTERDFKP